MGLIVSQSITHPTYGEIPSFYSRIEMYRLDKTNGELFLNVMSYYDKDAAELVNTRDLTQPGWFAYPITGIIQVNNASFDLNELNYHKVILTSSYVEYEDILEEQLVTEQVTSYQFDQTGAMTEVTKEEDVFKFVKVGQIEHQKQRIDFSPISSSLFEFSYNVIKAKYVEVFGDGVKFIDS